MKKLLLLSLTCFVLSQANIHATKLVKASVVDKDYIMISFKDGEVIYKDDGTGESAYQNHVVFDGDDELLVFGEELNVAVAAKTTSWKIISKDDKAYGLKGVSPSRIFRKSKTNNVSHTYDWKLDHFIFLELPQSMKEGAEYIVVLSNKMNSDKTKVQLHFDPENNLSEAVHVNMIAYSPESPVRSADLYLWLGDGGERDYSSFEGNKVFVKNLQNGEMSEAGRISFWKKVTDTEARGRSLTGSTVWNADFTSFDKPGKYRLVIEGVGCSRDFEIRNDAFYEPYRYSVMGYYYMRIGEDRMDMVPVPRRPLFIPGKDPENFTIYLTDLHPFKPEWREHRGDTWDEPHFKPAAESMFYRHRLPGNPTNPNPVGGHSDALDWDRHIGHVSNIYDLLLPYILSNGKLNEDNLGIGESGNGVPDLIDEAKNEVDLWLAVRDGDAYCHGLTNPTKERNIMFQAGRTNMAAWANAANCAMLADCYRILGDDKQKDYYTREAIKAFHFASNEEEQMLDHRQDVGDGVMRGRDFMQMAAAFLYNVTGDVKWEDIMAAESTVDGPESNVENRRKGIQVWATAAYIFSPRERHYQELLQNMKSSIEFRAYDHNIKHMDLRPSRRSTNDNYWQTAQNLHQVILAHAITPDQDKKALYEKAMVLEVDWGLGRNPSNTVEMTGLGERHIEGCYTSGWNDGTPGVHPGHTPYNNLDAWGRGDIHIGSDPPWFSSKCYPDWKEGGWPHQEGFFNCRYVWANGEFTPRQTMRGKMVLYGYLHYIYSY